MLTSTDDHDDALEATQAHASKELVPDENDGLESAPAVSILEQLPQIELDNFCAYLAHGTPQNNVARPLIRLARAAPVLYTHATRALMKWPDYGGPMWLMPLDGFGEIDTFAIYGLPPHFERAAGSIGVCTVFSGPGTIWDPVAPHHAGQDPGTMDLAMLEHFATLLHRLERFSPHVQPTTAAWFLVMEAIPPMETDPSTKLIHNSVTTMLTSTDNHDDVLEATQVHAIKKRTLVKDNLVPAPAISILEQLPQIVLDNICAYLAHETPQNDAVRPLVRLARAAPVLYAPAMRALMQWPDSDTAWLMPLDGFGEPDKFAVYNGTPAYGRLPSHFECAAGSIGVSTVFSGPGTIWDPVAPRHADQDPATTDLVTLEQLATLRHQLERFSPPAQPTTASWFLIMEAVPPEGAFIYTRVLRRHLVRIPPRLIRHLSFHLGILPLPPFLTRLMISGKAIPMLQDHVGVFRNAPTTLRELAIFSAPETAWQEVIDKKTLYWLLMHLPRRLETLKLVGRYLDDDDASVLSVTLPPSVQALVLARNNMTATGILAILARAPLTLATLDVSDNRLDEVDDSVILALSTTLARVDSLPNARNACYRVNSLMLRHAFHGSSVALATILPMLPHTLTFLDIGDNALSMYTVSALASHLPPTIAHLGVGHCAFDRNRIGILAPALPTTLMVLDLRGNQDLVDSGVLELIHQWKRGPQLRVLDLSECGISDLAVKVLLGQLGPKVAVRLGGNGGVSDQLRSDVAMARRRWTFNQEHSTLGV
ncbi:hypothetical protein GGF32_006858 [Allomyces javanicus]|nr:hypothetical protein GGF32_006858 [Allomyces javanicus]